MVKTLIVFTIASLLVVRCHALYARARDGLTSSKYQTEFNKIVSQGFRLKQVSGYASPSGNQDMYAAIWVKNDDDRAWVARHGMTSSVYKQAFNKYKRDGFRLVQISGYGVCGRALYAAIWEKKDFGVGGLVEKHGMSSIQYQKAFDKYTNKPYNYRLTCVSGYTVNGKDNYAAIWEESDDRAWYSRHGMTSSSYQKYFDQYTSQGFRLTKVSGYQLRGSARYAAIWEKVSGPLYQARHGLSDVNYQAAFNNQHYRGYDLEYVDGYLVGNSVQFAAIWHSKSIWNEDKLNKIDNLAKSFLSANSIPGASLAITREGKLVFAQGYGKADVESNHDASPRNLWRIASISKPITAVSIMKLVELGTLKLSDKVFGPCSILGSTYAGGKASKREQKITVDHLLMHLVGTIAWDTNGEDGFSDPMAILNSYSHEKLIEYILETREPPFTPGFNFGYSNFGYCILGRIIEKVTGKPYSVWVKQNILDPMGAPEMKISGNTRSERQPNEVCT